jgi:hypothetical protein
LPTFSKVPAVVTVIDAMPLNAGGKILKRELRTRLTDAALRRLYTPAALHSCGFYMKRPPVTSITVPVM